MDFKELRVKCMGNLGLGPCQHYHLPQRRFRMRIGAAQRCVWKAHRRVSEEQTLCGEAGAAGKRICHESAGRAQSNSALGMCVTGRYSAAACAPGKNERIGDG